MTVREQKADPRRSQRVVSKCRNEVQMVGERWWMNWYLFPFHTRLMLSISSIFRTEMYSSIHAKSLNQNTRTKECPIYSIHLSSCLSLCLSVCHHHLHVMFFLSTHSIHVVTSRTSEMLHHNTTQQPMFAADTHALKHTQSQVLHVGVEPNLETLRNFSFTVMSPLILWSTSSSGARSNGSIEISRG